jgi:hypothetical protein
LGEGSEDEDDILGDMNSDDDSDSEDDASGVVFRSIKYSVYLLY